MLVGARSIAALLVASSITLVAGAAVHPARSEEPAAGPSADRVPRAKCPEAGFRTVVDVGHTADKPGALSARGATEYSFNLQLAQDVQRALVDGGLDKTALMITTAAPPLGLFERAARANHMAADLFIAIHHDSVPDRLLQTWQYEGKENQFNDDYPGYALFVSKDNADYGGSLQFGKLLGAALQARGLHYTPHYTSPIMGHRQRQLVDADAGVYRYDQLIVLRETHMPALLLEAGSIVNRAEELELGTKERRALTSAAIVAAVDDFCTAHARRPPGPTLVKHLSAPAVPKTVAP